MNNTWIRIERYDYLIPVGLFSHFMLCNFVLRGSTTQFLGFIGPPRNPVAGTPCELPTVEPARSSSGPSTCSTQVATLGRYQ
jgi:hypothetical protein